MAGPKPPKDSNTAYRSRASKRLRTLGPNPTKLAANVIDEIAEDRRRKGRKQYRWSDLQGTDRIEMLRMVRDCAMAAMTEFEMASYFGVEPRTLTEWTMKDPEFAIAMRLPKQLADERVEKAIYHSALGFRFQSEEIKILDDGTVHRVATVKQLPPNINAATFWLKNRNPSAWRDRQDVDVSLNGTVEVTDKSEDPRQLAMAVLDVLQQAIYDKLPVTIDGEQAVAKEGARVYEEDLENMTPEQIEALFEVDPDEDR